MPKLLRPPPDYTEFKKLAHTRLASDDSPPPVPLKAIGQVSEQRRAMLEGEVEGGLFRDKGIDALRKVKGQTGTTPLGNVIGFSKKADVAYSSNSSSGSGYNYRGSGGTVRQGPNLYSPLWLMSNINLPRDRATINSWCRAFYALNAFVQNAISLHCTYPISKLNIKCKDKKIQNFFETLNEEINLTEICTQVALDYWVLGEAFPYAELNEATGKWSRISLQNPDYIMVQQSPVAGESLINLRPDEGLKRLVMSNKPADLQQRQKIDKRIVELVRQGKNIPLDNSYVSHLARKITPQETRGTGLLVSCFKALLIFDQIRECFDGETEILTNQGFKRIEEIAEITNDINSVGLFKDKQGTPQANLKLKDGIQIGCFNAETEYLEYHNPNALLVKEYDGEMIHFKNDKLDVKVTPNHEIWCSKKTYVCGWDKKTGYKDRYKFAEYKKIEAKDVEKGAPYRFQSAFKWSGKEIEFVDVCGKQVPIELYLEFLGYLISEGCVYKDKKVKTKCMIKISQTTGKFYKKMRECSEKFAAALGKNLCSKIRNRDKEGWSEIWEGTIWSRLLYEHFEKEICDGPGKTKSPYKKIPRWILELSPRLLKILLDALVAGDGSISKTKNHQTFSYTTISKQLHNDIAELVQKCGYYSISGVYKKKKHNDARYVNWSEERGKFPLFTAKGYGKTPGLTKTNYQGFVWCFNSPTGLIIVRRNGRVSVQGNCKVVQAFDMINPITMLKVGGATGEYKPVSEDLERWREILENAYSDPDFKIVTHDAVTLEKIGSNSAILDTTNDVAALIKEIYIGLLVPSVLMDGGSDTTYANGGVALDILKARYYNFRNMMTRWLRRKIFAPMSKMNEFYEYVDGKKTLVVPDVDWNHMSLFDAGDYIQTVKELATAEKPLVSKQTLYRSLGLDYEEEKRKVRREMIDQVILDKEKQNLESLGLPELRALSDDDVIPEMKDEPLPGEQELPGQEGDMGGLDSMPGLSDSGSNAPVPPGPPPSAIK